MKDIEEMPVPSDDERAANHRALQKLSPGERLRLMHDGPPKRDAVNPPHYQQHPSGVQCIQITEEMNFCLGNAVKYIWRADLKANAIEDLEKAVWYVNREIARRKRISQPSGDGAGAPPVA